MDLKKVLPWGFVAFVLAIMIPIAVTLTPAEMLLKLGPWKWVGLSALGVAFLYSFAATAYQIGARHGSQSALVAGAAPKAPLVSLTGETTDRLKYTVRELADLLMAKGECRMPRITTHFRTIERPHPAWDHAQAHEQRRMFLDVVREAMQTRSDAGNPRAGIIGDFTDEQRRSFQARFTLRTRLLSEALDAAEAANSG